MKQQTKLILKGIAVDGTPFAKEIRSLDEVKSSGNYVVVCKNATVDNGLPQINGKSHSCFCCEAQLTVTCCYSEDEAQSNTAYGQTLTICDRETGLTNTYSRTISPGKNNDRWNEWQMVATGDIETISQQNSIHESISYLSKKINNAIAQDKSNTQTYVSSGTGTPIVVSTIEVQDVSDSFYIVVRMTKRYSEAVNGYLKIGYSEEKPIYWNGMPVDSQNSWSSEEYVTIKYSSYDDRYMATPYDYSIKIKSDITRMSFVDGYYVDGNKLLENVGYRASGFYGVVPNKSYSSNYDHRLYFYDEHKNVIGSFITDKTFTVPRNCFYIRLSVTQYVRDVYLLPNEILDGISGAQGLNIDRFKHLDTGLEWIENGYLDQTTGKLIANDAYLTSNYIIARGDSCSCKARRVCFYNINNECIGFKEPVNGTLELPEEARYVRIDCKKEDKEHSFFRASKSNILTFADLPISDFYNNIKKPLNKAIGTVYDIPLKCDGTYGLQFKFKFPKNIQTSGEEVILASFGKEDSIGGTYGGFIIKLKPNEPIPNAPYQQIKYNGGISFYPSFNTNNNYRCDFVPDCLCQKPFTGEDLFSIKYDGEINDDDSDLVLTIDNTGLFISHSTDGTIVLQQPFADKDYRVFVSSLSSICEQDGRFDFKCYAPSLESTDDILRCREIPLIGNYTWGVDAFPVFIQGVDDNWHTVDIRFNKNGNNIKENADAQDYPGKGNNILTFILDGIEHRCIDNRFPLVGSGEFYGRLKLGGEGIVVKDFVFSETPQIATPIIVTMYAHATNEQEIGSEGNIKIALSTMQYIISEMKRHGFTFVPLSAIRDYLVNDIPLPTRKVWTMMHDDTFYLDGVNEGYWADANVEASKKFRCLYLRNNIKASFPMIDTYYTAERADLADRCKQDIGAFEFSVHSAVKYNNVPYEDVIADIRKQMEALKVIGTSNIFTYNQGLLDYNTVHILADEGIAIANTITNTFTKGVKGSKTGVAKGYYNLAQARLPIDNNAFDIEEFERMMDYYDSI